MDNGGREIEVRKHFFEDDGRIPNNPELPLLVYPQALDESAHSATGCKELLTGDGWGEA